MPEIPGKRVPDREDGTDGTRQCTCSNLLAFVENSGSNLAVFGLLFKTILLGEVLALSLGLALFPGDSRVCKGSVQVEL